MSRAKQGLNFSFVLALFVYSYRYSWQGGIEMEAAGLMDQLPCLGSDPGHAAYATIPILIKTKNGKDMQL